MFRKKSTQVFVLLVIAMLTMSVVAYANDFDDWMKAAQLGFYAEEEDWDAVCGAKEVSVVTSSSHFDALKL